VEVADLKPDKPVCHLTFTISNQHGGVVLEALGYDVQRARAVTWRAVSTAPGAAARALRHPAASASDAVRTARSILRTVAPISDTRSPVMQERRLGWHYDALDVPVEDLKRAARAADGTLNDVFLAGIAGGLERYHTRHGSEVEELRVTMPISIRKEGDPAGGNRITLMRFPVPIGTADVRSRVRELHARASASRAEPSIPLTNAIAGLLNLLPTGVVGSMLKHVDFLASNVPGLDAPIFVGGARLRALHPFGPTIGSALNVTLLSYCGTCNIGINTDTGAVPDPDVLMTCLHEGFEDVLDLGGTHEPVRRPGPA